MNNCRLILLNPTIRFDHHLTTTVQSPLKMPKKLIVATNNGLFLVLAVNVQNRQNSRFNVDPSRLVVVLRRQVPGVRIPSGAPKCALQCTFAMRFLL